MRRLVGSKAKRVIENAAKVIFGGLVYARFFHRRIETFAQGEDCLVSLRNPHLVLGVDDFGGSDPASVGYVLDMLVGGRGQAFLSPVGEDFYIIFEVDEVAANRSFVFCIPHAVGA